jgi:queuine tRNA-ribosyltransferase
MTFRFHIEKQLPDSLGRAGTLVTPHGNIDTPAFVTVGTKGTVKGVFPETLNNIGAQVVLANTYHLFLQPGEGVVCDTGGLSSFMNWRGPTMTDSGGFQVFSLGEAFENKGVSKFIKNEQEAFDHGSPAIYNKDLASKHGRLAIVDEEGVTFTSHIDGSMHRFTAERSIEIQHALGATMIFSFDECTSPTADHTYQKEAMERTHRWAKRGLDHHKRLEYEKLKKGFSEDELEKARQYLFGVVQGGRFEDLRKESARVLGSMDFDGFGIGGSFSKDDLDEALIWVNEILPADKPRHLLGIGEPVDLFVGIQNGCDLFDCVAPTRIARNGQLYTREGKINITNSKYADDHTPLSVWCSYFEGTTYTRSYLHHLFRSHEMMAGMLASINNLYFIIHLVKQIRQSILEDTFDQFREEFFRVYMV